MWGSLSEQSLTSYRLLEGVTAKKQTLLVTGDEMEAAVQFGLDSPFPEPEAATNFVYA